MKKYITPALALAIGTSFLLAGCSSPAPSGSEGGADSADGAKMTLITGSGGPYYEALSCGAQKAAGEEGVQLDVQFPSAWDPVKSTSMINAAAAKSPAALIIVPTDQSVLVAPIQQAVNSGIPVVTVDQELAEADAEEFVSSAVSTDNYAAGATAADTMAELIGKTGKVMVDGAAPGSSAADQRTAGFVDRITDEYPDITLLETQYSNSDPAEATQIVNATLAANPDLAGIYVVYQDGVIGAGTALRASDGAGDVALVGFDTAPAEIELLKEGIASALIAQQPAQMGYDAVQQAVAVITGGEVTKRMMTPTMVVTADNVDSDEVSRVVNASKDHC